MATNTDQTDKHISNIIAFIIAIEDYRFGGEQGINSVAYARNDAAKFKNLLKEEFDVPEENITMWLDKDALKAAFENELVYHIHQLNNKDKFIFYYAGHGFYQNTSNRLTCWDTYPTSLNETTVSLNDILLKPLSDSACVQSLIFLDCCATNMGESLAGRDLISSLNPKKFDNFINPDRFRGLFMSCSPGQQSYPSKTLGHGIWTWHLIEALKGNVQDAITRERFITDTSLKNYLSNAVPEFIIKNTSLRGTQHPYAEINAPNEFLIRELPEIKSQYDGEMPQLKLDYDKVLFRKIISVHVNRAFGFKRTHFAPDKISPSGNAFIQKTFEENIKNDIQNIYTETKEILSLRKREIITAVELEGGTVDCSFFNYSLNIEQNPNSPSEALVTRRLIVKVKRSELPENFDDIFIHHIDEIIIPIIESLDFNELVEKFENLEDSEGGKLIDNEMSGKIDYATASGLKISINTKSNELTIFPKKKMKFLEFIDTSTEGLKKISNTPIKLL